MPAATTTAKATATAPRGKRSRARLLANAEPMRNPSRERLKAELTSLRSQVDTLEQKVLALQQQQFHCHSGDRGTATNQYDHEDELDRRRASERENRRLRALLWRQIRTGRRTIAALTGQTPEMLVGGAVFSVAVLTVRHACQLHDDHGQRFTLLRDDIDRAFAHIDEVFSAAPDTAGHQSSGTGNAFATTVQSRVFGQREQQLVMEAHENDLIAFDLARCSSALWRAIHPSAFDFWDATVHEVSADVKTVRLCALDVLHGATVQVTCTIVVKRFVRDDGVALVWRAVTSSDASDCDAYIDETGWSLCTREQDETEAGGEATRKRTFIQWVPRSVAQERGSDRVVALAPKTGGFTNLVLAVTARDTQSITELMENLLIDDCMGVADGPTSTSGDSTGMLALAAAGTSRIGGSSSPCGSSTEYGVAL